MHLPLRAGSLILLILLALIEVSFSAEPDSATRDKRRDGSSRSMSPQSENEFQQLDQFQREIQSLKAEFEQVLYDEYGDALETSHGIVSLSKPGKFRWDYLEPYVQSIITNGKTLWIFDQDLEQVTVNPVPDDVTSSPLGFLVADVVISDHYEIERLEETTSGQQTLQWFRLRPKQSATQTAREYRHVDIGMVESTIVQVRLVDNLEQTTALQFSAHTPNQSIAPETFEFTYPPGIDVVHGSTN